MFSTSIGPELENNDNGMEEPKCYNVKEYQSSVLLNENKYEKDDSSITSTKKMIQLTS